MSSEEADHVLAHSASLTVPRSIVGCVPALWRGLLFPGTSPAAGGGRWSSWLWLLILPSLLLYPCLSFHLFEPDEGRYAEIPREMLQRGEWIVPYLQGQPYLDKPPLLYWLVMGSYQMFGVSDWSARLPPALAIHACILLTYWLGRRSLGERAAFAGALLLCLAPGFLCVGRLLILDGLLALWVTLSLLAGFEAVRGARLRWCWWLAAASACGLGILTKGPVALLLLVPPLIAQRWLSGGVRIGRWAWLALAGVLLAINLPWYVAMSLRVPEFARYFLWEHNVVRFLAPFDHLRPIWFYMPIVLFGLMPGTLLLLPALRFFLANDAEQANKRCRELGFCLLAGGWCVLFFSLSGCKLPTYILPAFPPLALALGYCLSVSRWQTSRWVPAVGGAFGVLLLAAHYVAIPWYADHHSPFGQEDLVLRYCADPETALVCYPRSLDSIGFYLQRDDLRNFRGKETMEMLEFLKRQPKAVVMCSHRHSMETLRRTLPPELRLIAQEKLFGSSRSGPDGWCYMAVVERIGACP